jgi:rhodanese-related sulfurtransferase
MSSFLAILPLAALLACGADDAAPAVAAPPAAAPAAAPAGQPGEVDVHGLKAAMDASTALLIDVRTPEEFAEVRAAGAINIPLDQLSARMSEISPAEGATVYLICRSGARSGRATKALAAAGFAKPTNVAGGTLAWQAAGLPVESGPPSTGDAKVE